MTLHFPKVAVTGGAGYVGSALAPSLLRLGYDVKVIDLFLYGDGVLDSAVGPGRLTKVNGDIRDAKMLERELKGIDAVIHLACISNDPSFELNPGLGRSINYDSFFGLLAAVRKNGVRRFIYASSSSVYGVKEDPDVREESSLEPLTDYSKYKAMCEKVLRKEGAGEGQWCILRPATVCGWAPRLRLDLTVNILTIHALVNKKIRVFGGSQLRPNINIKDMIEAYRVLLEAPADKIDRKVFNAGFQNHSVKDIAEIVRKQVADPAVEVVYESSEDLRSYHINSDKIARELGFRPRFDIEDAVSTLVAAWRRGLLKDPMTNSLYYNIKRMKEILNDPEGNKTLLI